MRLLLAIVSLALFTGASLTDYHRVQCLDDEQQLPVYVLVSEYAYTEDDPATEEDERDFIEAQYHSSAVVFRPGYVLTAEHSVDGSYDSLVVKTPLGDREAERLSFDVPADLALLKMDTTGLPILPLAHGPLRLGETLWNIGYPAGGPPVSFSGPYMKVTSGELLIGAPVFPGMSGGAAIQCVDGEPRLAGILVSYNNSTREWSREDSEGQRLLIRHLINDGTSNATGYMTLHWFTEYSIAVEKMREKKQQ